MPYKDKNNPKNIAYRKSYYEKTKEGRYERTKHNIYKWRQNNSEKLDALNKEYYADNRKKILNNQKLSYRKNINKRREYEKKESENLTDRYVKKKLLQEGFTRQQIRKAPELIETKRLIIKTKRLCKTSKI